MVTEFFIGGQVTPLSDYIASTKKRVEDSRALLSEAIETIEEDIIEFSDVVEFKSDSIETSLSSQKIFLVHGHDETAKEKVARFLERLDIEVIILHEQPDMGRTIVEKFENFSDQVGFAVVLFTPDDVAGSKNSSQLINRARQNVVFELGYFSGKLGRGKTCLLRKGDVEIPSDLYGVLYTNFDEGDTWKMKILKEMKSAGIDFDANKAW